MAQSVHLHLIHSLHSSEFKRIMSPDKKQKENVRLHLRNKNRERYDLSALITATPDLKQFVVPNKYGVDSVDFSNPEAVKLLNTAILNHYYGIKFWEFPDENLCPPIPGRADYLHHLADLLAEHNSGTIPIGNKVTGLDIGIGASCIYPIVGAAEYNWRFIGADIDANSIASSQRIIDGNDATKDKVECRLQANPADVLHGVLDKEELIDFTICNPPFHASAEEAQKGTKRKVKNLSGKKTKTPELNFSGISNELICEGGEYKFIENLIRESEIYAKNCFWFSTLVSKQSHLKGILEQLKNNRANIVKTIPMGTGNKSSRVVAWTFLSKDERKEWSRSRWRSLLLK